MADKKPVKVIPLGGLEEIGKNMTVIEYENDLIVIDCGLTFPEDEMLGIDIVIPDISYLIKNQKKIRGIVLTHGHEDHIGAIPYLLKKINVPIYGTRLTLGLLENKLKEHGLKTEGLKVITTRCKLKLGIFEIEFIATCHSIPDSVAIAINTPHGRIIHTGDFKIDYTPIMGKKTDFYKFAKFGEEGVLALLADSTNVEREGYTMSEKTVGDTFDEIFMTAKQRILVATFASNVQRIQQIINASVKVGRKIVVSGRSMVNVVSVAKELGYLKMPENTLIDINELKNYSDDKVTIITTGSQGEPMSALSRISNSEHRKINLMPGDLVIISATPIPGNEKTVSKVIDMLLKRGARVIYESLADIHVSGHARKEELKLIHSLVRPKFFMPVHGEYRHIKKHAELAYDLGMPKDNVFLMENGQVLNLTEEKGEINGTVQSGQILVDGLGVGDVGNIVLRDRKHLSEDGLIVVVVTMSKESGQVIVGPDIVSRGFVYVRESEDLMGEAREIVKRTLNNCEKKGISDWATLKSRIRDSLKDFLYEKIKRNPMILPIIMEI
ncbi:MAG: ribonuclease J [Andreesenia angusta]|nr:ribonuclease J [Andreesenia angusta]